MGQKRFSLRHLILAALGGAVVSLALLLWATPAQVRTFAQAWGTVSARFVGEYDPDAMLDSALDGLVAGTGDRWSYYLSAEEYAEQTRRRENTYVGVGITVVYTDPRGLLIQSVAADSPAQAAGLAVGELITAVDGVSIAGEAQSQGVERIQGEEGTAVTLTVLDTEGREREVTVTRSRMEEQAAVWEMLPGKVGYVRVLNFYAHSADQVASAVEQLQAQGATGLVFDLRNNGGGFVDELTAMLDPLLPEGPIFRSQTGGGAPRVTESDAAFVALPMVSIVNANTYSAAEIFAAQLQESVGAGIVGEHTSGKGYSQQALPLRNGGALNISTGRYTTGNGTSLVGVGVTLDAEVTLDEAQAQALWAGTLGHDDDPQLQAALKLLD